MKKQIMIKVSKNLGVEITIPVHDLSEGGLAVALAESAFDKGFGVSVKTDEALNIYKNALPELMK